MAIHCFVKGTGKTIGTGVTGYADVPDIAIAGGGGANQIISGHVYLIVVNALFHNNGGAVSGLRVMHGSTAFSNSEHEKDDTSNSTYRHTYTHATVWTATGSEGLKLQGKPQDSGSIITVNYASIMALDLTAAGLVLDTDYFFDEQIGDTSLVSGTWTTTGNASKTFTPGTAAHDWLVITCGNVVIGAGGSIENRMGRSGEASSSLPFFHYQRTATGEITNHTLFRVFSLGASSNTFQEETRNSTSSTGTRKRSFVFAMDLNKFVAHANVYTEGTVALTTSTAYATEVQTLNFDPGATRDCWVFGTWNYDANSTGNCCRGRLQVDDADAPSGQTTDSFLREDASDTANELPIQNQDVLSLNSGTRVIAMDGSREASASSNAQQRVLFALALEVPSGGGGGGKPHHYYQQMRAA